MPPSCVAQKSKNKDAQRAHRSISEVDEESHTEHSEPTDEGGEDDSVPSQGNAVQRMIIDSVSKVANMSIRTVPRRLSDSYTAEEAPPHRQKEDQEGL